MKKKKKSHLVYIEWLDADNENGWLDHDPDADDDASETLKGGGVLVSEGVNFVTICFFPNPGAGQVLGKCRIPKSWIVKMEIVKEFEP